jgi:WD40 repeat protein
LNSFQEVDQKSIWSVAVHPDGHVLAARDADSLIWVDLPMEKELRRFEGHREVVWSVALSADGNLALSGGGSPETRLDCTLRLWDVSSGRETREFEKHHQQPIGCVAFSPDGRRALSGSADAAVRLWNVETGRPIECFNHDGIVESVAFSADGSRACRRAGTGPFASGP